MHAGATLIPWSATVAIMYGRARAPTERAPARRPAREASRRRAAAPHRHARGAAFWHPCPALLPYQPRSAAQLPVGRRSRWRRKAASVPHGKPHAHSRIRCAARDAHGATSARGARSACAGRCPPRRSERCRARRPGASLEMAGPGRVVRFRARLTCAQRGCRRRFEEGRLPCRVQNQTDKCACCRHVAPRHPVCRDVFFSLRSAPRGRARRVDDRTERARAA
jgi:hypothetical protein